MTVPHVDLVFMVERAILVNPHPAINFKLTLGRIFFGHVKTRVRGSTAVATTRSHTKV